MLLRSVFGFGLACSLMFAGAGCDPGETTGEGGGGSSGGSGGGGEGGSVSAGGSAKPMCTNPDPPTGPTPDPRADSAGALRADGSAFLLFGGDVATVICGQQPAREHVSDTWLLDTKCGGWTKLEIAGPSARARHAMALDAVSGKAVLFGGRYRMGSSGAYTNYNDVWTFDFATQTWTELAVTGTGPSARSNTAAAVVNGKFIVFGGNTSTSGLSFTPKKDVFALDLATNTWTEITPANAGPPARLFHAMAAHPTKNVVYIFSGGDENAFTGPFLTDTWAFDLDTATWTKLASDTPDGTGRIKLGMWATVPDGATDPKLYVFGGHDDGTLGNRNDVLSGPVGASIAYENTLLGDVYTSPSTGQCDFPVDFTTIDPNSPERRSAFAVGQLPDGSAAVVFGGDSDCGRLSDAAWFDTRTNGWTPIRSTLPGLVCLRTGSTTCTSLCN
ncbi:MAG: hypothetical protein IPK82_18680 [Polyangiaceae bacterium]|nr:hypothetical protein [Polyangiaceae bacterium]